MDVCGRFGRFWDIMYVVVCFKTIWYVYGFFLDILGLFLEVFGGFNRFLDGLGGFLDVLGKFGLLMDVLGYYWMFKKQNILGYFVTFRDLF